MTEEQLKRATEVSTAKEHLNSILFQISQATLAINKKKDARGNITQYVGLTLWYIDINDHKQVLFVPDLINPTDVLYDLETKIIGELDKLDKIFKSL